MVGSCRGCIPAEIQQVSAGWLEAPQRSLRMDIQPPTDIEGLPKNGSSDFFLSLRGISLRNRDLSSVIVRSRHRRGRSHRDLATQLWK